MAVTSLVANGRVVTLTGSGGCGKTRLAIAVLEDLWSRFADGARWVDLQGVTDPAMVVPALGAALGVPERAGREAITDMADRIGQAHLLVVLDNCEHLVDDCAHVTTALLAACPRLHILATSRVPLLVEGEASFDVPPLPVPAEEAETASLVAVADAARLFEARARQVVSGFRLGRVSLMCVAR